MPHQLSLIGAKRSALSPSAIQLAGASTTDFYDA